MSSDTSNVTEKAIESILSPNERVVYETHQHWVVLVKPTLQSVVVFTLLAAMAVASIQTSPAIAAALFLAASLAGGYWVYRFLLWRSHLFVVTNQRVVVLEGVLRKRNSHSLLKGINDIVVSQSPLGRLLRYGDVRIVSGADAGTDWIVAVHNPAQFRSAVFHQMSQWL